MIQGFCRVGCDGPCGRWLLLMEGDLSTTVAYPDLSTAFPTVTAAEKAVAKVGWVDPMPRECSCGPVRPRRGHELGCPVIQARRIVCPKCQRDRAAKAAAEEAKES